MMTLADEIERQTSLFAVATRADAGSDEEVYQREISRGRNGFFAMSGAFIGFGRGTSGGPMDLDWYRTQWTQRACYSELRDADFVFGCDIFADLLFMREGAVLRLDGETGDCVRVASSPDAFAAMTLEQASELLGGNLARQYFGGRYLDEDPMRLLPTAPFVTAGGDYHSFLTVPLTVALRRKAVLSQKLVGLPDGAGVDLTFWHEEIH